MKPEETVDFHIKRTWQSIAKMYNEEAAKYGATMAVGYVLLNIDLESGTPSTSLGPKMGMESTSLSRILKNMENDGLIERKPNPLDGRGVLIYLTPFGKEKRQDARRAVLSFNQVISDELGPQKINQFLKVITRINDLIINRKIFSRND